MLREMSSISKQDFQYMLGCLPNLAPALASKRQRLSELVLRAETFFVEPRCLSSFQVEAIPQIARLEN